MAGLLLTRPGDGNTRFTALLPPEVLSGFQVIETPLMQIEPTVGPAEFAAGLEGIDRVIFTSRNGVKFASQLTEARRPSFCVGRQTTKAACDAGWPAKLLGLDSDQFVSELIRVAPRETILHLRGKDSVGDIAQHLQQAGIRCHERVIYRQVQRSLSVPAQKALDAEIPLLVPLFSAKAATHFSGLVSHARNLSFIVMSAAVAMPLRRLHYEALHVSKTPDAEAMAAMLSYVAATPRWVERRSHAS